MNSKHFKEEEFGCNCCGTTANLNRELFPILELVRLKFGKPVIVTSGVRCSTHNKNVGGSKHSQHLAGNAADIVVRGVPAHEVYDFLNETFPNCYGVGKYVQSTHIDVRQGKARW